MGDNRLFIGNLSWDTNDESLREAFSQHGVVTDAKVIMDRYNGRSRGFGFVTYQTAEQANTAKEQMHGANVDGREVRVESASSSRNWCMNYIHIYLSLCICAVNRGRIVVYSTTSSISDPLHPYGILFWAKKDNLRGYPPRYIWNGEIDIEVEQNKLMGFEIPKVNKKHYWVCVSSLL